MCEEVEYSANVLPLFAADIVKTSTDASFCQKKKGGGGICIEIIKGQPTLDSGPKVAGGDVTPAEGASTQACVVDADLKSVARIYIIFSRARAGVSVHCHGTR
jgi:hypothetical protein